MPAGTRISVLLALVAAFLAWATGTAFAAAPVLVVTGSHGAAHDEVIAHLRYGLRKNLSPGEIAVVDVEGFAGQPLEGTRIIVTAGSQAAVIVRARNPGIPVLNILVTKETHERVYGRRPNGRTSAIFLDQPVRRQIAALIEALPGWPIAMIAGPQTTELVAALADMARSLGVPVATTEIDSERELYPAMQRILAEPAVLLAVPDPTIFNSHTIQNILLTSYRQQTPIMGFSPAYVRAGALIALYSTPAHIGAQAAEAVSDALEGRSLPPPGHPNRFKIGINVTVARSLGITLDAADTLTERVMSRERGR